MAFENFFDTFCDVEIKSSTGVSSVDIEKCLRKWNGGLIEDFSDLRAQKAFKEASLIRIFIKECAFSPFCTTLSQIFQGPLRISMKNPNFSPSWRLKGFLILIRDSSKVRGKQNKEITLLKCHLLRTIYQCPLKHEICVWNLSKISLKIQTNFFSSKYQISLINPINNQH